LPDPHAALLAHSPAAIVAGMHWVLGFMVLFAIAQLVVSSYVPRKKADHTISATEAMESSLG